MTVFIEFKNRTETLAPFVSIKGDAEGTIFGGAKFKCAKDYAAEIAWTLGKDTVAYVDCRGYGMALAEALSRFMTVHMITNPKIIKQGEIKNEE